MIYAYLLRKLYILCIILAYKHCTISCTFIDNKTNIKLEITTYLDAHLINIKGEFVKTLRDSDIFQ